MEITAREYGKGAKAQTYYLLSNSSGGYIARLHTLEEAAIVSRYLQGFTLTEQEEQRAKAAIKSIDEDIAAKEAERQARAEQERAARAERARAKAAARAAAENNN